MTPAPVERCRVLELGCGNGSNIIPMAASLPTSNFVGIDLAGEPVAEGNQIISELALQNIRLVHGSITTIGDDWGQFDYIIAHGLFSWVPAEVRSYLLKLCRERLAPQGVAFISYNAFPGCHMRNMLREMMLFHTRNFKAPDERVQQAKALAQFLAGGQDTQDEYQLWMKAELKAVLGHDEGHLYHDELAEISEPLYFTQFFEQASSHELQYLGEADYFEMFDYGFNEPTRETLQQLSQNRVLREQYLDFLKCRRFRQTLLCHREIKVSNPQPAKLQNMLISSPARCLEESVNLQPGVSNTYFNQYQTPKGARCATDFILGKVVLAIFEKNWPVPLPFAELLRQAQQQLLKTMPNRANEKDTNQLCGFLLDLYSAGLIELYAYAPSVTCSVSNRPSTTPLVRWQAQHGNMATSQFHMAVKIEDEIGRLLLTCLDGSRDRKVLADEIGQLLKSREALNSAGQDESSTRRTIETELETNLEKLARMGLLTG
jgi:methyltransferase-like protein/SAM-dependent methyltransferase